VSVVLIIGFWKAYEASDRSIYKNLCLCINLSMDLIFRVLEEPCGTHVPFLERRYWVASFCPSSGVNSHVTIVGTQCPILMGPIMDSMLFEELVHCFFISL
jgi:hypothetical protein